jgi:hypothetical protein
MSAVNNPQGAIIRSTQRGTVDMDTSTSKTATITAVVTAKSQLRLLGFDTVSGAVKAVLTNSTTITITSAAATTGFASWELTEFVS